MWSDLIRELGQPRPESLQYFVSEWYGREVTDDHPAPGQKLPRTLEECYDLAGAELGRYTSYYRFLPKCELDLGGEHTVICRGPLEEDFEWSFSGDGPDPDTYERVGQAGWRPTGLPLSALILYAFVSSAVFDASCGLVNMALDRHGFEAATVHLQPLHHPLWAWPDPALRFYFADGVIAQAGHVDGEFGYQVILAAISPEKLRPFGGIEWEWDSRE